LLLKSQINPGKKMREILRKRKQNFKKPKWVFLLSIMPPKKRRGKERA